MNATTTTSRALLTHAPAVALGAAIGVSAGLVAVNHWPQQRLAPALVTANNLRIGVDEHGAPALCDSKNTAYSLTNRPGTQGVAYRADRIEMPGQIPMLVVLHCRP
ncbi:Uncharacterised protein [Burkholderia pseudomallei]|nr:Uncharacterised protein [Burkholderia pseudomallei]